MLFTFYQ